MGDRLKVVLDSYDEHLLEHVDRHGELKPGAARWIRQVAEDVLAGRMSIDDTVDDWMSLVIGFVSGYEIDELEDWMELADLEGPDLSPGDRQFLTELVRWLDRYLAAREAG